MKIVVIMHEDLVPPEGSQSFNEREKAEWKTEYEVMSGLRKLKYQPLALGLRDDLGVLRKMLFSEQPKIVFNLLEEFAGEAVFDQHIVSYLELNRVKYTGCNPRGLMLARDKALSKKILKYHRLPTPDFLVFRFGRALRFSKKIKYPLFVKSLFEEASLGITQSSVVYNEQELKDRVEEFFAKIQGDVIAEEYIEGRELYLSILGNDRLQVFPAWELFFDRASSRTPLIATEKVKWDFNYRQKVGVRTGPAADWSESQQSQLAQLGKRVYRALGLTGYARLDLRLDKEGRAYVIEANPNPDIGDNEDFAASAQASGVSYPQLLDKIIRLGLRR